MFFERFDSEPDYKKNAPQSLREFRGIGPSDPIELPEADKNRKCTDVFFLILFIICIIVLFGLTAYFASKFDLKALTNGMDECGNICGISNKKGKIKDDVGCEPRDYTNYAIYNDALGEPKCITEEECKSHRDREIKGRSCVEKKTQEEIDREGEVNPAFTLEDVTTVLWIATVVTMQVVAIALSILLLVCLYWKTKPTFMVLVTLSVIFYVIIAGINWFLTVTDNWESYLVPAIVSTLLALFGIALLTCLKKKRELVIRIYEETMAAVFKTKSLMAIPFVMTILQSIFTVVFLYMMFLVVAVGIVLLDDQNTLTLFYVAFLAFMFFWIIPFFDGCQVIIIAGAISRYFFARDKAKLQSQLLSSVVVLLRYHLGTVCTGSFLIAVVKFLRMMAEASRQNEDRLGICVACILCLLSCIEEILHYVSRKAYIMTAIHGKSFCKSGMRAIRLIWHFFLDTLVVEVIGNMIIATVTALFFALSILAGVVITLIFVQQIKVICIAIGAIFAVTVLFFYGALLDISIGTLFLCYCEDKLLNDGSKQHPYYMSPKFFAITNEALQESSDQRQKKVEEERRKAAEAAAQAEAAASSAGNTTN